MEVLETAFFEPSDDGNCEKNTDAFHVLCETACEVDIFASAGSSSDRDQDDGLGNSVEDPEAILARSVKFDIMSTPE